jgi:hypothetical protein
MLPRNGWDLSRVPHGWASLLPQALLLAKTVEESAAVSEKEST